MKQYTLLFFILISFFPQDVVLAQDLNPLRLELSARLDEDTYTLIPCGDKGFMVFYEGEKSKDKGTWWHFALFDTQMKEVWIMDTMLLNEMKYHEYAILENKVFLLYYNPDRSRDNNLQLLKIDLSSSKVKILNYDVAERSDIAGFEIIPPYFYSGFNHRKNSCSILRARIDKNEYEEILPDVEGELKIQKLFYDRYSDRIFVTVEKMESRDERKLYISTIKNESSACSSVELKTVVDGKFLNTAQLAFEENNIFILGTYSNFKQRVSSAEEDDYPESSGYFISRFEHGAQKYIYYYNFLELENTFNTFGNMDVMRVKRKANRKKDKDASFSLDYRMILHPVSVFQDELVLLAEAFYPEYRTVTNMTYDYYGRMIPQTYTVFDGYKYLSGIVASFDRDGKLVWNNEIGLNNLMSYDLTEHINIFDIRNEMALFFNNDGKVFYKIIGEDGSSMDDQNLNIKLKYTRDRIIEDEKGKMVHWYDEYFLCYGYQEIRNNSRPDSKRTVFYISKIAFR